MASIRNLVDGINILRQYYDNPDGYYVGADHDEIYLYCTDRPVSKEHFDLLTAMEWHQYSIGCDNQNYVTFVTGWGIYT
jgi:hypothetical protein